jgi:hypothetical protein
MSWCLNHFTAAQRLARKLKRLGDERLVPPETFHVTDREGPLYDGELERAETWAAAVLEKSLEVKVVADLGSGIGDWRQWSIPGPCYQLSEVGGRGSRIWDGVSGRCQLPAIC